jgi:hypothetical protein
MSNEIVQSTEVAVKPQQVNRANGVPPEVLEVFARISRALKEIPWVSLGAISTGLGAATLYFYFRSIDYMPSDLAALIGASAAVAGLALVFLLWVVFSLVAPSWAYQSAGVFSADGRPKGPGEPMRMDWWLLAFQMVGVGAFLLLVAHRMWSSCKSDAAILAIPGGVLLGFALAGWIYFEFRARRVLGHRINRTLHGAGIAFAGMFPFLAIFSVLNPSQGVAWLDLAGILGVWMVIAVVNAWFLGNLPIWAMVLVGTVSIPILAFSVPAAFGHASLFPTLVAELAGIRARTPGELRVPKATCDLIRSALNTGQGSSSVQCGVGGGEWGAVNAQVLSNLGERWLIKGAVDAGGIAGAGGDLRITIPGADVQTVRRVASKAEVAASCHRSFWS